MVSAALPRLRASATSALWRERRSRGSGSSTRCCSTRTSRCGRSTRTRAGRRATSSMGGGVLFDYHYGEGAYAETELAIQELLGVRREPLAPLRPEDAPGAQLAPQSADCAGAYSGPYEAGGVWAVFDGRGTVRVGGPDGAGRELEVAHPGAYPLLEHERHIGGGADPGARRGGALPGHVLHARGSPQATDSAHSVRLTPAGADPRALTRRPPHGRGRAPRDRAPPAAAARQAGRRRRPPRSLRASRGSRRTGRPENRRRRSSSRS